MGSRRLPSNSAKDGWQTKVYIYENTLFQCQT